MNTDEKCAEVMSGRGWTQRRLAEELGISESSLSSARQGRRKLPAHAWAQLERFRGVDDRSIVDQIIKTAACAMLASVTIFLTPPQEARAAQGIAPSHAQIMHIMAVIRRSAERYSARILRMIRSRLDAVSLSG